MATRTRTLSGCVLNIDCYVNVDEFANRYNLLARQHELEAEAGAAAGPTPGASGEAILGNQDWAARVTTLPPADCS